MDRKSVLIALETYALWIPGRGSIRPRPKMSYRLTSLRGGYQGTIIGVIKGVLGGGWKIVEGWGATEPTLGIRVYNECLCWALMSVNIAYIGLFGPRATGLPG